MRLALALMALLAFLISPLTVAAAQRPCIESPAMGTMKMAAAPVEADSVGVSDKMAPCCTGKSAHKIDPKGCAQVCAAWSAATAVLCKPFSPPARLALREPLSPVALPAIESFEPAGLSRPPKSLV
jgi:hypothetical protein